MAVVLVAALGACSSSDGTAATTTTAPTTTTTVLARDTQVAVRQCVDAMNGVGLMMLAGSTREAHDAQGTCQEAINQLDVDSGGVVGQTVPNQLKVLISERNLLVAMLAVKATSGQVTGDQAGKLDGADYVQWSSQVSALLDQA